MPGDALPAAVLPAAPGGAVAAFAAAVIVFPTGSVPCTVASGCVVRPAPAPAAAEVATADDAPAAGSEPAARPLLVAFAGAAFVTVLFAGVTFATVLFAGVAFATVLFAGVTFATVLFDGAALAVAAFATVLFAGVTFATVLFDGAALAAFAAGFLAALALADPPTTSGAAEAARRVTPAGDLRSAMAPPPLATRASMVRAG